jgi:beta-glucosidase
MAEATFHFPKDFLWGTATAAHQVEGGNTNNDWWAWEQADDAHPKSGQTCDWWNRAEEDITRMAELHTNAHRLSIEWSRIEPSPATWDYDAIDRYRAILTAMREAGIQPMVTLHHFTNPMWLAEQGGWLNPEAVDWFKRFVAKAVAELVDLCHMWCTVNEPNVLAVEGYMLGRWPPGHTNVREYFQVVYHLLQAHAAAYEVIHDMQPASQVGLAKHMTLWEPWTPSSLNRWATRMLDRAFNEITLTALKDGVWRPPIGRKSDEPKLKNTLDWIGLNYYQRYDAFFDLRVPGQLFLNYRTRPDHETGPAHWGEIYPEGLFLLIQRLYKQFGLPIAITENGRPDEHDAKRPRFILEHLRQIWRAISFNWPVTGYYFWSLLDNFEWAEGYDPRFRFGLYAFDRETQARTLRKSGELYAEIAETGSLSSDMTRRYAPEALETLFPGGPGRA